MREAVSFEQRDALGAPDLCRSRVAASPRCCSPRPRRRTGIERALVELCEFLEVDRATAFIVRRGLAPRYRRLRVGDAGRSAHRPHRCWSRPAPRWSPWTTTTGSSGLPRGRVPRRRPVARCAQTGSATVRACRVPIGDDAFAVSGSCRCSRASGRSAELQMLRLASRDHRPQPGCARCSNDRCANSVMLRRERGAPAGHDRRRAGVDLPASIVSRASCSRTARSVGSTRRPAVVARRPVDRPHRRTSDTRARSSRRSSRAFDRGEGDDVRVSVSTGIGEVHFDARSVPELDEAGNVVSMMVYAVDVTDQRRLEDRITLAATTDPLTGLANRVVFVERLAAELDDPHGVGPRRWPCCSSTSTASSAPTTASATRSATSCCARSANGFARACGRRTSWPGSAATSSRWRYLDVNGRDEVEHLVDQLRREIGRPIEVDGMSLHATVSIGVAIGTSGAVTPTICCAAPITRCTRRSGAAGTAARSSTRRCATRSTRVATPRPRCAPAIASASPRRRSRRWPRAARSPCTTSPRSTWPRARWWRSRRSPAGTTRHAGLLPAERVPRPGRGDRPHRRTSGAWCCARRACRRPGGRGCTPSSSCA